ncbi:MAG: hypothetical protein RIA09_05945 [Hoeflea sp.]|uniref:hypothetical protein n=1 Tax=Hoeflea sp. TaxID=1940281 RepID=UPI0032EC53E8
MSTFDLAAKIVTTQQKAWVVHAGIAQRHSGEFLRSGVIFLETPDLDLNGVKLDNRQDVRRALRRSLALDKHYHTTGSTKPSIILGDYDGDPFDDTSLTALAGGVARMFGKIAEGDVVMSPGIIRGAEFNTPVIHFGEVVTPFDSDDVFSGNHRTSRSVPVRRVNWLSAVPRKEISLHLERKINKPPALREIAIDRETEEILQHTYKSYVFENTSSSLIEASKYDGSDFITLTNSQYLIAALVAAHYAVTNDQVTGQIPDFDAFVREHFQKAPVENIVVDFASPGSWRLIGASASMAAFVALGVAIFTSDLDLKKLSIDLTVTNSVSAQGSAELATQENMKTFLRSIDHINIKKLREQAQEGKLKIGLSSSVQQVAP